MQERPQPPAPAASQEEEGLGTGAEEGPRGGKASRGREAGGSPDLQAEDSAGETR